MDTATGVVLVHGGGHDARCWEPTTAVLRRRTDRPVLAVDLPGRGASPGPLRGATIESYVRAVVRHVEASGLDQVVLVGHSMAGMVVPGAAADLGPDRVRRCVLIAANVAPPGRSVLDDQPGPARLLGRIATRWPRPYRMPKPVARALFCNGMTPDQTRFVLDRLVPEAGWLARQPIPPHGPLPPITWVLTERDRAVRPALQRRSIAELDVVDETVEIDGPHDVMVSHPEELATAILAAVARVEAGR